MPSAVSFLINIQFIIRLLYTTVVQKCDVSSLTSSSAYPDYHSISLVIADTSNVLEVLLEHVNIFCLTRI